MAEIRIPLSHSIRHHGNVIPCAFRGQEVVAVKVTDHQLIIRTEKILFSDKIKQEM